MDLIITNLPLLLRGLWLTVRLSALIILFGTLIGAVGGYLILFAWRPVRMVVRLYVDVFRGLPLLVTIFIVFYGAPVLYGVLFGSLERLAHTLPVLWAMVDRMPWPADVKADNFWSAVVALSLFAGAHTTEVVRGGVGSVNQGQWMAARSIGLRFWPALRYVIMPQALRRIVPPWINTCVEMVKATSLVSLVSLVDLLLAAQQVLERTKEPLLFYGAAAAIYFVVCFSISRLGAVMERRFAYDE